MTCWGSIAAVVVELFLADSETIQTFDQLLSASPHSPILVLSHLGDEDVAKLAGQHGARDYLLQRADRPLK